MEHDRDYLLRQSIHLSVSYVNPIIARKSACAAI